MITKLPKIKIGKRTYYVDMRPNQLRNVKNPQDCMDLRDGFLFFGALKFKDKFKKRGSSLI